MARKKSVPVTFAFGSRDRVDPKFAPFGVLDVGQNLRVRKDGRLGTRNGYVALPMGSAPSGETMLAYDLHEYRGRLIAFGSNDNDYPTDLFEYVSETDFDWRGTDPLSRRVTLNPFSDLREVGGIPQPQEGSPAVDGAIGSRYACLAYVGAGRQPYFVIVDQATDQTIYSEVLTAFTGGTLLRLKVVHSEGTFFIGAAIQGGSTGVLVRSFTPGLSTTSSAFFSSGSSTTPAAFDMCAVSNPANARVAIGYALTAANPLVRVYDSAGVQVGSSITFVLASVSDMALEADETDNTVNVYTAVSATGTLRTFNFAGTLLDGPTSVTSGGFGTLGRLAANPSTGFVDHVVVAVSNANGVTIQVFNQDTHALDHTIPVGQVVLSSNILSGQSRGEDVAVVFTGFVSPEDSGPPRTNAIFYVTPTVAHMTTRDYLRASLNLNFKCFNLSYDPFTGSIGWVAQRFPGNSPRPIPVLTLLGFKSTARRHTATYGGLLYIAGATPSVYDGRVVGELGFQEAPGIRSLTAGTVGELTPGGTYYYTVHWEFVLADGSLMLSPVSVGGNAGESETDAATITLGPAENKVTLVVTTPHSVRVALGDALYGGSVIAVVSRTEWIVTATPAVLLSTRDFSATPAAAGDFTGQTLQISVNGGGTQTVTFGAADNALAELVAAINTQTTGLTASSFGNSIYLECDTLGTGGSLTIVGGTTTVAGAAFIGFLAGDTSTGESSGVAGSTIRRCVTEVVPAGMATYGATLSIEDEVSDATLGTQEAIYTQGERGVLSGPLEQNAPRSCNYITATESRLLTGGLARTHEVQISRAAFPSEAFSFSEFSPFFAVTSGAVIGVQSLDTAKIVFTTDSIYSLTGEGPDDLGGNALDPPVEIPTPSGLSNAWSLLKGPDGLWFQLDDSKLFRIPRGGGAPEWMGIDAQDTLEEFPVIKGTCRQKRDNAAVFACCSDVDGQARLLVRDFRTENWMQDTPPLGDDSLPAGGGIDAITSYGETLAYCSASIVYTQSIGFADDVDDFIVTIARTEPLYPFGVGGYGNIYELLLTGEFRGTCTIECRVSYDDGASFTQLESFELSDPSPAPPDLKTIQRKWALPQDITNSIVIEFAVTDGGVGPTEGFVFNQVDLLVEAEDGLRELNPDEQA